MGISARFSLSCSSSSLTMADLKTDAKVFGELVGFPKMLEGPDDGAVDPNMLEPVEADGLLPNRLVPEDGPAVAL